MKNTVTQEDINLIVKKGTVKDSFIYPKTTVVALEMENGFTIVESSSCVDKTNYDHQIGVQICLDRIKNKLWELEGYVLQKEIANQEQPSVSEGGMNFREALINMKDFGYTVRHQNFPGDGFWGWYKDEVYIFTRDGEAFPLKDTDDFYYTLGFIINPKWEIHSRDTKQAIEKWSRDKGAVYFK